MAGIEGKLFLHEPDQSSSQKMADSTEKKIIIPMDSLESLEADILEDAPKSAKTAGFVEDYSIKEGTTLDNELAKLRKQPKVDELYALDLQWRLDHQVQEAKETLHSLDKSEVDEKILERIEVAALIKRAEEKLLPVAKEERDEQFEEVSTEMANISEVPELVTLDKIIQAADLIRMESSDLSEEEGFRLRLSCILEESESDTSGSGVGGKRFDPTKYEIDSKGVITKKYSEDSELVKSNENTEKTNAMDQTEQENVQSTQNELPIEKSQEILQVCNALEDVQQIRVTPKPTSGEYAEQFTTADPNMDKQTIKQKCIENDNQQAEEPPTPEEAIPELDDPKMDAQDIVDSLDSIESSSPEPCFGIRRLQSGTRVDNLLTKPALARRLESSSDSSLDMSLATPGIEEHAKSLDMAIQQPQRTEDKSDLHPEEPITNIHLTEQTGSDSSLEISTVTSDQIVSKSKSTTPENVIIELETSTESPVREQAKTCNIMEITDEEVQAMFPKVKKIRRGKSLDHENGAGADNRSIASCDVSVERIVFPKVRKSRRGKSLESGMAERQAEEEKKNQKNKAKQETQSNKGEEERPPVPPETYLWEELRRWRMKGGYPWTYLDKPPFDEKTWKNKTDHEYEPINPPPLEKTLGKANQAEAGPSREAENARHFLRIPRDDELVLSAEDMEVEAIGAARDLQDDLDDRFIATPMTTTTASRTDCDVNTSMLDSSGLEDLPLKRDSRSKKALQSKTDQMRAQAQGLQQRIRSQAGKLRNKLRSIPRPSFQRKQEREKTKAETEERPRFRLPERPKFSLPERPKFKMPQKPKISLPNFTKPLRERQAQAKTSNEPRKNLFDLDFKTYPRMFNKKSKERGEYATSSPKMARSATPPPRPIQPARKKGPVGQRWVNRFDDIKFVDDRASEMSHRSERSDRSEQSESLSGFHDHDLAIADDVESNQLPPARTLSTKSSISHLTDHEPQSSRSSEERHRKGVLEEIDSDQFFLREKGISEDDIVGRYLSDEIREAFRSPVVNALRQLDMDYDDKHDEQFQDKENIIEEPLPPTRMRSLKRTPRVDSKEEKEPVLVKDDPIKPVRYENVKSFETRESKPRYENTEEDNLSEYYKSPGPPEEYMHYKVPKPTPQATPQPVPAKRKSSATEAVANKKKQNGWVEVEIETSLEEICLEDEAPQPLQRRKSKKSLKSPQISQDAENKTEPTVASMDSIEPDYIIPVETPPEAPKRTRSLSRGPAQENVKSNPIPPKRTSSKSIHSVGLGNEPVRKDHDSRSVHSLAFDDRKAGVIAPKRIKSLSRGSRSFQSLANDEAQQASGPPQAPERTRSLSRASQASRSFHSLADDERSWAPQAPDRTRSLSRTSKSKQSLKTNTLEKTHHYETPSEDGYAGYAVVEKPKPPRPPPPRRRKGSRSPTFNTLPSPRKSPIRPVRNYATLGPSRPPRKPRGPKLAQSLEHIYSDQISQSYIQIEDNLQVTQVEDLHGSSKDLSSSDVVEKMKGRPLPAPPRPPRLKGKSEEQNPSVEEVEEVCVSTQTDPLPDDVCLEDDMIQEFSHEQLKLQEAFLQEMREEEERIQKEIESKRARHIDVTVESEQNEAKMEIIRQMDDIIREERRLLLDERQVDEGNAQADDEEAKKTAQQLEVHEDDMGYASLDRRQVRPEDEPQPSTSFQQPQAPQRSQKMQQKLHTQQSLETQVQQEVQEPQETRIQQQPLHTVQTVLRPEPEPIQAPAQQQPVYIPLVPEIVSTDRLRVGQLEVDRLSVNQLEATNLSVQELRTHGIETRDVRGTNLQIQDIVSHSGNLTLGNIELPPEFIRQIIARIPWEEIRPPPHAPEPELLPTAVQAPPLKAAATNDEPATSSQAQGVSTRRRHRAQRQQSRSQYSSDEESGGSRQVARRPPRAIAAEPKAEANITELGQQLARACTNAGLRAMRQFAANVRPPVIEESRARYVQAVLCVALVAIAGFILLSLHHKDVHHHHWDFQFPPQPPKE